MVSKTNIPSVRLDPVIGAAIRSGRYRVVSMLSELSSGIEPIWSERYLRRYRTGTVDQKSLPGTISEDEG